MMENNSLQVEYVTQLKDYLVNEVQGRRYDICSALASLPRACVLTWW